MAFDGVWQHEQQFRQDPARVGSPELLDDECNSDMESCG